LLRTSRPQFDPKEWTSGKSSAAATVADYGDRTTAYFKLIPRAGFERNRWEIELLTTYGHFHYTDRPDKHRRSTAKGCLLRQQQRESQRGGLMPQSQTLLHERQQRASRIYLVIFNASARSVRLAASARDDFFQVPNDSDQKAAGYSQCAARTRRLCEFLLDTHPAESILLTVSPFDDWNARITTAVRLFASAPRPAANSHRTRTIALRRSAGVACITRGRQRAVVTEDSRNRMTLCRSSHRR